MNLNMNKDTVNQQKKTRAEQTESATTKQTGLQGCFLLLLFLILILIFYVNPAGHLILYTQQRQ